MLAIELSSAVVPAFTKPGHDESFMHPTPTLAVITAKRLQRLRDILA